MPEPATTIALEPKVVVTWDTCQIALDQQEYILDHLTIHDRFLEENVDAESLAHVRAAIKGLSGTEQDRLLREHFGNKKLEEAAFHDACGDQDVHDQAWEHLVETLGARLQALSPDGVWFVEGRNLGWQHRSGYKQVTLHDPDDARLFLQSILPDCDCTYTIHESTDGKALTMTNAHHDAPTGEGYTLHPCGRKAMVIQVTQWADPENSPDDIRYRPPNLYGAEDAVVLGEAQALARLQEFVEDHTGHKIIRCHRVEEADKSQVNWIASGVGALAWLEPETP